MLFTDLIDFITRNIYQDDDKEKNTQERPDDRYERELRGLEGSSLWVTGGG